MKKSIVLTVIIALLLSSCASYTISKESLVAQLKETQNVSEERNVSSLGTNYYSNNLSKIKCIDKMGQEVWLYSGKNMNFKITNSTNESLGMYFDTVIFQNDTLFGLKSRILGGKRMVPIKDITKIIIQAEDPRTEPVK